MNVLLKHGFLFVLYPYGSKACISGLFATNSGICDIKVNNDAVPAFCTPIHINDGKGIVLLIIDDVIDVILTIFDHKCNWSLLLLLNQSKDFLPAYIWF